MTPRAQRAHSAMSLTHWALHDVDAVVVVVVVVAQARRLVDVGAGVRLYLHRRTDENEDQVDANEDSALDENEEQVDDNEAKTVDDHQVDDASQGDEEQVDDSHGQCHDPVVEAEEQVDDSHASRVLDDGKGAPQLIAT